MNRTWAAAVLAPELSPARTSPAPLRRSRSRWCIHLQRRQRLADRRRFALVEDALQRVDPPRQRVAIAADCIVQHPHEGCRFGGSSRPRKEPQACVYAHPRRSPAIDPDQRPKITADPSGRATSSESTYTSKKCTRHLCRRSIIGPAVGSGAAAALQTGLPLSRARSSEPVRSTPLDPFQDTIDCPPQHWDIFGQQRQAEREHP
jgi:hypothetical protein